MDNNRFSEILKAISKIREISNFKPTEKKKKKQAEPIFKECKAEIESLKTEKDLESLEKLKTEHSLIQEELKMKFESKIQNLKNEIQKLQNENSNLKISEKKLRNENLDLKGAVRIYCRIKPALKSNIGYTDRKIEIEGKSFTVEKVFGQKCAQKDIFEDFEGLVENVMDGYRICVFAYGQTGSGKTYTMEGNSDGLIFNSIDKIQKISKKLEKEGFKIRFEVKYLEIYNETIIDLFTTENVSVSHDGNTVFLKNCSEKKTDDACKIYEFIERARKGRSVAATQCNSQSSRSHAVFMVRVLIESETEKKEGTLSLIDLAGSERLSESKAENQRLKETQNINKSLSALGNVFTAIKKKEKHVPFRDSKLTHLMQDHLSGQSRIAMIVNINPENTNESVCSLRFATKVSECALGMAERNCQTNN